MVFRKPAAAYLLGAVGLSASLLACGCPPQRPVVPAREVPPSAIPLARPGLDLPAPAREQRHPFGRPLAERRLGVLVEVRAYRLGDRPEFELAVTNGAAGELRVDFTRFCLLLDGLEDGPRPRLPDARWRQGPAGWQPVTAETLPPGATLVCRLQFNLPGARGPACLLLEGFTLATPAGPVAVPFRVGIDEL